MRRDVVTPTFDTAVIAQWRVVLERANARTDAAPGVRLDNDDEVRKIALDVIGLDTGWNLSKPSPLRSKRDDGIAIKDKPLAYLLGFCMGGGSGGAIDRLENRSRSDNSETGRLYPAHWHGDDRTSRASDSDQTRAAELEAARRWARKTAAAHDPVRSAAIEDEEQTDALATAIVGKLRGGDQ